MCALGNFSVMAVERVLHGAEAPMEARQWDVVDIVFAADGVPEQPMEVELSATVEDGAGNQLRVPGFYDGGNEYVVRFAPPAAGSWTYRTSSTLASLNGLDGELRVQPPREGRKGPIGIDPATPREFRYANGDTYYPIAFECDWLFALDAENANDIPLTRTLVDALAENGFNQVVMNVFAYDVDWGKDKRLVPEYDYGSPKVFPFGGTNADPDHSRLNIEYFQRLDRVIAYLDEQGIASHLMIYVWNKLVNWPAADSDEDNRYFDYVVKRYQAFPNLIWDISKEALGYGRYDVRYISRRIERLRRLDAGKRLVSVHDYDYNKTFPDMVDFISVQLWNAELYHVMRNVCKEFPDQPILNIEHGGYEKSPYVVFSGSYTDPVYCLERSYLCVFAGTFPSHYWQGMAWNVVIPDIAALNPEDRPHLEYYRVMRSFVDRYDVGGLIAGETKSNSGFCLHNDKDLFIYFVPKETIGIGVQMPKLLLGRTMKGTWFNPLDGTYSDPVRQEITTWPHFSKPEHSHFDILIVEIEPEEEAS